MHLFTISRGIKHDVDRMITELQGKFLPFDYKGSPGLLQLSVRPIQLWEIVFPEPQLQTVLKTFKPHAWERNIPALMPLKIALGASSIPKIDDKAQEMPIFHGNVEFQHLGIKKDRYEKGVEQI